MIRFDTQRYRQIKSQHMSSNMRILKTCEFCKIEFIAKKTSSKTCSDGCAKRLYKQNQRSKKIEQTVVREEVKKKPSAFVDEQEIKAIQAKENLTLKEAALANQSLQNEN